jgi:hypothetical protein
MILRYAAILLSLVAILSLNLILLLGSVAGSSHIKLYRRYGFAP